MLSLWRPHTRAWRRLAPHGAAKWPENSGVTAVRAVALRRPAAAKSLKKSMGPPLPARGALVSLG
jgi:hypothetical protein